MTQISRNITKDTDLEKVSIFDEARQRWFESQTRSMTTVAEVETVAVFCDLCSAQDDDTRHNLIIKGWGFGRGDEYCPKHFQAI